MVLILRFISFLRLSSGFCCKIRRACAG
jgi:hypothetical protein